MSPARAPQKSHAAIARPPLRAWRAGYGIFAVSESNLSSVHQCIADQQEHHRRRTFQEQYRAFLLKHNVRFDERYVWD